MYHNLQCGRPHGFIANGLNLKKNPAYLQYIRSNNKISSSSTSTNNSSNNKSCSSSNSNSSSNNNKNNSSSSNRSSSNNCITSKSNNKSNCSSNNNSRSSNSNKSTDSNRNTSSSNGTSKSESLIQAFLWIGGLVEGFLISSRILSRIVRDIRFGLQERTSKYELWTAPTKQVSNWRKVDSIRKLEYDHSTNDLSH